MAKRFFLVAFIQFICVIYAHSQQLTENTEISLITCGSGKDLYSTFGHSAVHISDRTTGLDRVYNYGTFDFDTPNFYVKFARGKLNYMLNVTSFERFIRTYQIEGRWVKRQLLNLTDSEKEELYAFLENNALPENRDYKYDFFYDNCSTRIRDVLENLLGDKLHYPENPTDSIQTFRNLIDLYLTDLKWSDFGIDLALGAPTDKVASWREKMFLPDYLMSHIGQAEVINNGQREPLVSQTNLVLAENEALTKTNSSGILWIFWLLFAFSVVTSFFINPKFLRWFDIVFFMTIGILGIFIGLLWFATDHTATKWNFNMLWALPTWIWGAILLIRKKPNSRFFKVHAIIMFAILIFWIAIPQDFHAAVVPVILALAARSWSWQIRKFHIHKN
ncbi:DUF4105 domain-containing protein [Cryomorpha ignava]|uniref:DUF4105 domain-containing protein n=1 Tax=Cryomorpha ignava TaxID=101383 RepID=A0A7K3WL04_9FLAO|nr:DUF4105 domain-containing protein [Cryomorpha ignava]NEN22174.1 DUF4105 domain-containing protein [Cryomorpha ignava]